MEVLNLNPVAVFFKDLDADRYEKMFQDVSEVGCSDSGRPAVCTGQC